MSGELNPFARLLNLAIDGATETIRTNCTEEEFEISAKMFLQVMLPSAIWRRNYSNVKLSSFVSIADESFAYLCLENNVEEWIEVVEGKEKDNPDRKKGDKTKWTGPKSGKNVKGRKRGWSLEGRKRYNKLFLAVIEARKTKESSDFENNLLQKWKAEDDRGTKPDEDDAKEDEEETRKTAKEGRTFRNLSGFDF